MDRGTRGRGVRVPLIAELSGRRYELYRRDVQRRRALGASNLSLMATNPQIPRRWTIELDGIRWLPRLIDKARMRQRGRLGTYLLGHSPVDKAFFDRAGVTTEEFAAIVAATSDDGAVLAGLRAGPRWNEERVRRWSARFTTTYRRMIPLWDLDEGHRRPNPLEALGIALFRPIEAPAMRLIRRFRRAP